MQVSLWGAQMYRCVQFTECTLSPSSCLSFCVLRTGCASRSAFKSSSMSPCTTSDFARCQITSNANCKHRFLTITIAKIGLQTGRLSKSALCSTNKISYTVTNCSQKLLANQHEFLICHPHWSAYARTDTTVHTNRQNCIATSTPFACQQVFFSLEEQGRQAPPQKQAAQQGHQGPALLRPRLSSHPFHQPDHHSPTL